MRIKKIIRDSLFLLTFCACFYGLIRAVNRFGKPPSVETATGEYSADRLNADAALIDENWVEAVESLERMLENDPFDGTAWYRLGNCHYYLWRAHRDEKKVLEGNSTDADRTNADRIADAEQQSQENLSQAVAALEHAVKYAPNRNISRLRLASVLANVGRKDEACKLIAARLDNKFPTPLGLSQNPDFLPLIGMPEFERLVVIEDELREAFARNASRGGRNRSLRFGRPIDSGISPSEPKQD